MTYNMEKILNTTSRIISWLFSPLFIPTYAMIMMIYYSQYQILPFGVKVGIFSVTFLLSGLLPLCALLALKSLKMVRDLDLYLRHQRTIPYIFTLVCYIGLALFLYRSNAPIWMMGFIYGGIVSLIVVMFINLRWKISAHLTALGGLLCTAIFMTIYGLATIHMLGVICAIVMVMGLTASSRIILDCHTPMQLLCGALCGFVCTAVACIVASFIDILNQPAF